MLTIREEQRAVFRSAALQNFHAEMQQHLAFFAPERARVAGPEASAAFVSNAIEAARARGLHLRGPIRLWLELMCVLGHDFDTDPQYRALWPDIDPAAFPMPFAQRLHRSSVDYLAACFGPDRVYLMRAIAWALQANPVAHGDTAADCLALLRDAWPEKLAVTGKAAIEDLITVTDAQAGRVGLVSADGRLLVAMLGLCFGAGVLRDPLYPWLHARLLGAEPEAERINRTRRALVVYARRVAPAAAGAGAGS